MERVRQAVESCDSSSSAPVVIFVSKMIPVKKRDITDADGRYWRPPTSPGGVDVDDQDPDSLAFVAFARVLSGTVTPSTPLLVSFFLLSLGQAEVGLCCLVQAAWWYGLQDYVLIGNRVYRQRILILGASDFVSSPLYRLSKGGDDCRD